MGYGRLHIKLDEDQQCNHEVDCGREIEEADEEEEVQT
jgi:hypothetical protein